MGSLDEKYLDALKALGEDDFTKRILKPLFEAMGYTRVDFNGGPLERGRDLIAQIKIPPQREPRVTYIQSKKIGTKQNTFESAKFTQLIHQLRQCLLEEITTIDGTKLKADDIYIACPEMIKNRFMEEVGRQLFDHVMGRKIIPYDGPRILEDIETYKPELFDILVSENDELFLHQNTHLINNELLSALNSKKEITIDSYYSDLGFFVGSVDSNLLFDMKLNISKEHFFIADNDYWDVIKNEVLYFKDAFGFDFICGSVDAIESKYYEDFGLYKSKENMANIYILERQRLEYEDELNTLNKMFSSLDSNLSEDEYDEIVEIESAIISLEKRQYPKNGYDILNFKLSERVSSKISVSQIDKIISKASFLFKLLTRIEEIEEITFNKPSISFSLNAEGILKVFNEKSDSYRHSMLSINSGGSTGIQLKRFLHETQKSLKYIEFLKRFSPLINGKISFYSTDHKKDRVSISPHNIFSTGYDVAVYGGAGVGKTTTLQAYVTLCSTIEKNALVYIPLNRVLDDFNRNKDKEADKEKSRFVIQKIILLSKKKLIDDSNIEKINSILINKSVTLILDGLDEVYSRMPFITNSIADFKKHHPNVQLIISSRDCVSYLSEIDFIGITLLPFTKDQLFSFILGWMNDKVKAKKLIKSIDRKDIYEYIKTPLLATIVCSLVEKGIDAPTSEFEIYNERLKLFTGEYDLHKRVNRQKQKSESLILCARKIAFSMHANNIRSSKIKTIRSRLRSAMSDGYSDEFLNDCIEELENPCNILIKDRLTNEYSFGHVRFQEHLVSCELSANRNIDLVDLTVDDWWNGVLSLYAQGHSFFDLIEEIYKKHGRLTRSLASLRLMIQNVPINDRRSYNELINGYLIADRFDGYTEMDF